MTEQGDDDRAVGGTMTEHGGDDKAVRGAMIKQLGGRRQSS